jgi:TolA-binding protein
MGKFVNATLAIVVLVAGFAPINAQAVTQPASSGVSQQEFQHTINGLKSQIRHNDRKIEKAEKRIDNVQQTQVQQDVTIINTIDHQHQQDQRIDHTAKDVQDLGSRTNRWLKVISAVLALAIIGGAIFALRSRKKQSAIETVLLPNNAPPTAVKAYAQAKNKIGKSLPYLFEIRDPDPNDSEKKVIRDVVEGKVHHAGTRDEYYQFGTHKERAPDRHKAAIAYHEELQAERSLRTQNA